MLDDERQALGYPPHAFEHALAGAHEGGANICLHLRRPYSKRQVVGHLKYDESSTLDAVEKVLMAHIGEPIQAIGDLDV